MPDRPQCIASQHTEQSSLVYNILYNVLLGHLYILYYFYLNVSINTSKKKKHGFISQAIGYVSEVNSRGFTRN